ncbi:hypothetical protein ScPMuIL_010644 [Solemya velum]
MKPRRLAVILGITFAMSVIHISSIGRISLDKVHSSLKQMSSSARNFSRSATEFEQDCSRLQFNFFFLKVPKCASGTTMNIFLRIIMKYNLNILISKIYLNGRYRSEINSTFIPKRKNESYNSYVDHYDVNQEPKKNFSIIAELLPQDAVFLAIVRDPFRRFLSWLAFRKFEAYNTLERRAKGFENYTGLSQALIAHPELLDNSDDLSPNRIMRYFGYTNSVEVDTFISNIFRKFDFFILAEYYDESIILLKRRMCWRLEDVIYSKVHVVVYSKKLEEMRDNGELRSWFEERNYADMRLYNETMLRFKSDLQRQRHDFFGEVEQFRNILRLVQNFCDSSQNSFITIEPSVWNGNFTITTEDCVMLSKSPEIMKSITSMWQYSKLQL